MLQIIHLSNQTITTIRAELESLDHHLQADVSNYAKGRMRLWLKWQYNLKDGGISPAIEPSQRLWNYCTAICKLTKFEPDLGLVAKGNTGISLHRDARYADFKAVSIQIGKAEWTYDCQYPAYGWVPNEKKNPSNPETIVLEDCAVVFNCKNPYTARPLSEDRYSINLWKFSSKYRKEVQL
jgi:hypothetical protein